MTDDLHLRVEQLATATELLRAAANGSPADLDAVAGHARDVATIAEDVRRRAARAAGHKTN